MRVMMIAVSRKLYSTRLYTVVNLRNDIKIAIFSLLYDPSCDRSFIYSYGINRNLKKKEYTRSVR